MGDYEGALGRLSAAGLDQLTEKSLPTRSLRIVAESYAIKGERMLSSFLWSQYIYIKHNQSILLYNCLHIFYFNMFCLLCLLNVIQYTFL